MTINTSLITKGNLKHNIGNDIYRLANELFPICRSITGDGVRETLGILKRELPELQIHEVPTGTKCFDWTVPNEWNVQDAYVIDPDGNKIIDFKNCNLHLVGYSVPIKISISLSELNEHLYSLPDQPNAIPYVTSYYEERWGFCITHNQRIKMKQGKYEVFIDSSLKPGYLTYGELLLPGRSNKEVFLSTYICHPSLANNEISGPCVTTFLAKWIESLQSRNYSYRVIFIPETIGSITYLSKQDIKNFKDNIIAGFNITCVGDNNTYSYLSSRDGNSYADVIAKHVLKHICPDYQSYTFLDRGSDERQYCSPGIDLPVVSVMRTKYGEYPEYHTSLDNLSSISPVGLEGGFIALKRCLECIERNILTKTTVLGEPQLGRRGLYPTLSRNNTVDYPKLMMDVLAYSDGIKTLLDIANIIDVPIWELFDIINILEKESLIKIVNID